MHADHIFKILQQAGETALASLFRQRMAFQKQEGRTIHLVRLGPLTGTVEEDLQNVLQKKVHPDVRLIIHNKTDETHPSLQEQQDSGKREKIRALVESDPLLRAVDSTFSHEEIFIENIDES